MRRLRISLHALAAVGFWFGALTSASADVMVLESKNAGLKRGDRLPETARLQVPSGGSVKILRPGGGTQQITGPFDQIVRDVTKGEKVNEGLWRSFRDQLDQGGETSSIGATRSIRP